MYSVSLSRFCPSCSRVQSDTSQPRGNRCPYSVSTSTPNVFPSGLTPSFLTSLSFRRQSVQEGCRRTPTFICPSSCLYRRGRIWVSENVGLEGLTRDGRHLRGRYPLTSSCSTGNCKKVNRSTDVRDPENKGKESVYPTVSRVTLFIPYPKPKPELNDSLDLVLKTRRTRSQKGRYFIF